MVRAAVRAVRAVSRAVANRAVVVAVAQTRWDPPRRWVAPTRWVVQAAVGVRAAGPRWQVTQRAQAKWAVGVRIRWQAVDRWVVQTQAVVPWAAVAVAPSTVLAAVAAEGVAVAAVAAEAVAAAETVVAVVAVVAVAAVAAVVAVAAVAAVVAVGAVGAAAVVAAEAVAVVAAETVAVVAVEAVAVVGAVAVEGVAAVAAAGAAAVAAVVVVAVVAVAVVAVAVAVWDLWVLRAVAQVSSQPQRSEETRACPATKKEPKAQLCGKRLNWSFGIQVGHEHLHSCIGPSSPRFALEFSRMFEFFDDPVARCLFTLINTQFQYWGCLGWMCRQSKWASTNINKQSTNRETLKETLINLIKGQLPGFQLREGAVLGWMDAPFCLL